MTQQIRPNDRRASRPSVLLASTVVALLSVAGMFACSQPQNSGESESEVAATSATATTDTAPPSAPVALAGSRWRLVELQSMDDAIGIVAPDDRSLYTMALGTDGRVNLRLDCNSANGTWKAEPSADGTSGSFEIGPLAMTRAMCPPGSLDTRIAREASSVRSFVLKEGRLHLSLMADGGIQVWEPDPTGG